MAIGLYLSEGSVRSDGRTTQFTFATHEIEHENVIRRWAEKYHLSVHTAFGKGTRIVYVFSKALADWLAKDFGNGAYNKKIPPWLMAAGWSTKTLVLEYYFRGDGCFWDESRADISATTRSKQLAQQIQLMLLWREETYSAAMDSVMDHGELRYRISVGGLSAAKLADEWDIRTPQLGLKRSKRYNYMKGDVLDVEVPIRSVMSVPYTGQVFNLEVERSHSYCVPFVAHNCWVEKDALEGVVKQAAHERDVAAFSCRGYTSMSSMWEAARRLTKYVEAGQRPIILHLGDFDPSGLDMTRDIRDRLNDFVTTDWLYEVLAKQGVKESTHLEIWESIEEKFQEKSRRRENPLDPDSAIADYADDAERPIQVIRIALTREQIDEYDPPPNPAKTTDARFIKFQEEHGDESWELDALEPSVLNQIIGDAIDGIIDDNLYDARSSIERRHRDLLHTTSTRWDSGVSAAVARFQADPGKKDPPAAPAPKGKKPKKGKKK